MVKAGLILFLLVGVQAFGSLNRSEMTLPEGVLPHIPVLPKTASVIIWGDFPEGDEDLLPKPIAPIKSFGLNSRGDVEPSGIHIPKPVVPPAKKLSNLKGDGGLPFGGPPNTPKPTPPPVKGLELASLDGSQGGFLPPDGGMPWPPREELPKIVLSSAVLDELVVRAKLAEVVSKYDAEDVYVFASALKSGEEIEVKEIDPDFLDYIRKLMEKERYEKRKRRAALN